MVPRGIDGSRRKAMFRAAVRNPVNLVVALLLAGGLLFSAFGTSPGLSPRNASCAGGYGYGSGYGYGGNPLTISIDNVTHNEGNSGTTAFTFPVSLSDVPCAPVTVDFAVTNGTAA